MFLLNGRRPRQRMEFALPTINVIFLLILYFLSAGTLAEQAELSVPPPQTVQVPDERLPRPLLVVDADQVMALDGVVVADADIADASLAAIEATGAGELNLLVPRNMAAAPFLALLARLDAAGVPVRLVTVERPAEVAP
ncbi:hypothetical protein ASD80_13800 [Devosia sp. Root635]|nr:hypothetical protein ASD80_13800 [Devosia sp. Root635]